MAVRGAHLTIPVIALTGYLGAAKTSLLNHVLRAPGARIGVVNCSATADSASEAAQGGPMRVAEERAGVEMTNLD